MTLKLAANRPRLLVDFDDVIHDYLGTGGWHGGADLRGAPIAGSLEWLAGLNEHFEINIFSTRNGQVGAVVAIQRWFRLHWPAELPLPLDDAGELAFKFPAEKVPAMLTIDDRAWRFTGIFPTLAELQNYRTWTEPTLPLTDLERRHKAKLEERHSQLEGAAASYRRLAGTPEMRPEWRSRLNYIAHQVAELALDLSRAIG